MTNPIQIAIAEDNKLSLKSILEKLSVYDDIKVQIIAGEGQDLCEQLELQTVDVILMDIEMPVMNGITATEKVRKAFPSVKVIMLTNFDDDDNIFNAILAGASGYLLKDEDSAVVYNAIKDTLNGGAAMSPAIAWKTLQYVRRGGLAQKQAEPKESLLSTRETEILIELKNGSAYKQIADVLAISEGTVRKHIENIYRKLQVNNKVSALNTALENRWI
jgi:DNA-binding NarL/FixJ family response regulator